MYPPPKSRSGRKTGSQDAETWPVYGAEPAGVLKRLQDACSEAGSTAVNLSPRRVASVLGLPNDVPGRAPEVLPGILWEWTKTTTPPHGEAPVDPYFSGIDGADYSVSLLWRIHVPKAGDRLWPRATDREAVGVSLAEVRRVLGDEGIHRLGPDGVTVEPTSVAELRPGDQIVLPSDRGLLDRIRLESGRVGSRRGHVRRQTGIAAGCDGGRTPVRRRTPGVPHQDGVGHRRQRRRRDRSG